MMLFIPAAGGPSLTAYVLSGAWRAFKCAFPRTAVVVSRITRLFVLLTASAFVGLAVFAVSMYAKNEGYNGFALFNSQPFDVEDTAFYKACAEGIEARRAADAKMAEAWDTLVLERVSERKRDDFLGVVPDLGPDTRETEEARCRREAIRQWR